MEEKSQPSSWVPLVSPGPVGSLFGRHEVTQEDLAAIATSFSAELPLSGEYSGTVVGELCALEVREGTLYGEIRWGQGVSAEQISRMSGSVRASVDAGRRRLLGVYLAGRPSMLPPA